MLKRVARALQGLIGEGAFGLDHYMWALQSHRVGGGTPSRDEARRDYLEWRRYR